MGITGKDIMKRYEERNSAPSAVRSYSVPRENEVTARDIMDRYESGRKVELNTPSNPETVQVSTRDKNYSYAQERLNALSESQRNAVEKYNENMNMYRRAELSTNADSLVGTNNAALYLDTAMKYKKESGLTDDEFDSYAKNLDVYKDAVKAGAYEEKKTSKLSELTESQMEEITRYNLAMQQYKNSALEKLAIGQVADAKEYSSAVGMKQQFMDKYGVSEEDFDKYAQYVQETEDKKYAEKMAAEIRANIQREPGKYGAGYTAADILMSPLAGILATGESIKSLGYADKEAPVNTNSYLYALQNMGATTEEAVSEEIDNPVGKFAYNVGVSTAKSALGLALRNQPLTLASFGGNAYSAALKNAQDKGISKERAIVTALGAGAAEIVFEKVSLDKLYDLYKTVGKTALKDTVIKVLAQSGIEASEEVFTELSNIITDGVVNGDLSDYEMNVRNYMQNGESEESARVRATVDAAAQVAEAGVAGFISGGIMGGGASVASKANYKSLGKMVNHDEQAKAKVIETAQNMNNKTTAKEIVTNTKAEDITDEQMAEVLESLNEVDSQKVYEIFSEIVPVQEQAVPNSIGKMEKSQIVERENKTERNHGVTKAIMTNTNEPVIALKFEEVSKDKATVRLNNDSVVPLDEVQMETRGMQNLYNAASTLNDTNAANTMLDRYNGQPLDSYATACAVFYNAGQLKTASFDEMVENPKNASLIATMGDTATLYQMFSLGRNNVENIAPVQKTTVKKMEVKEGKVIDNRTYKAESRFKELAEIVAKRTGLDIELNDTLEQGERGHFAESLGKIAISSKANNQYETLVHELMEYANSYNTQKMQEVYDMALEYALSSEGAQRITEAIKSYQNAYQKVEHNKTFQSASEEFLNDYIAGVFSTEEGVRELVEFMAKENVSTEQQKSILQTVADFFKELADKISQYIDEHILSDVAKMGLRAEEKQARQIRESVLNVLEDTIGSESVVNKNGTKHSLDEGQLYLGDEDVLEFVNAGKRANKNRRKAYENGDQIIIKNYTELKNFVNSSISGDIKGVTVGYGKVGNKLADKIHKASNGSVDVRGFFLELTADDIRHGFLEHETAKRDTNLDMSSDELIDALMKINDADVKKIEYHKDKRTDVVLSLETDDGNMVLVEVVSLSTGGIKFKTGWKEKRNRLNTAGNESSNPNSKLGSVRDSSASNNIITQSSKNTTKKSLDIKLSIDVDLMSILEEEYSQEENDSASIIEEGFASLKNVNVDKKVMHRLAYKLKKEYKSAYSIEDLTNNLTNVFAYLKDHPDANYQDMVRIMSEVARPVIDESTDVDAWEKTMYDNFRSYFKGKTIRLNRAQIAEVEHYYDSFEKFRRQNFGTIQFSAKNGTYLDSLWSEIVQQSNYMLEEDTVDVEQPIALMDVMSALKPVKKNIYGMNTEQASYDLALDIFRQFFAEQAQEKANEKVTKKALRLVERQQEYRKTVRKEFNESVARLREYDREKRENMRREYQIKLNDATKSMYAAVKEKDKESAKKYADMEKFYKEQLRLLKQESNDRILAIKASNRQNMANRRAHEEKVRVRERIIRNAKGIINYFNTNTDKRHVPEVLKTPIAQFITCIDFVSERANPNSAATLAWQDSLNLMYRRLSDKGQAANNGYEDVYMALNGENGAGDVLQDMNNFLEKCAGKRVTDLTVSELEWLDGIITALRRAITDINRLYVNKRTQNVAELGTQSIQELLEKKDKKSHSALVEKGMNVMDANMLDSRSYFDRLGEAAFSIFDELRTAFNERVWLLKEAQDYMAKVLDTLDVSDWTGENAQIHEFVINGAHLQMTTAQIMSLYELNKRNQAKLHMSVGGIRPTDIGKGSKKIKRVTAVKLTSRDIDMICNTLTTDQKAVADKIQKFLAENCAKWGNKASMQMYGYERFGAKNYFPIRTDGNTVDTKDDSKFWFTKNQGFTKETVKNASNPLIVSDIFEVFTKHVTDMASYSTYSAAMMDAMKWYNFRSTELQGDVVVYDDAVKTQIERVYGKTYLTYFTKLIEDINAENKRGIESELAELLTSNMKTASVGANLRVAIQQPTAYLRAAAIVDPKYLSKALFKKSAMEKAKKYSAITLWKSWGYFETSIGRSMQNVLTGQKTWKEKVVDKTMAMAQFMDDFTWGYLWNACELEISDKYKKVEYDSPEYLKLVSERFDEVVDQTQVVDTVLHKSHIMRSKNLFNKMVTSFMSEPTKSYNLLMNKVRDVYEGKKGAKKALARATSAYIVTQILNAAIVAIVDAYRDWKEEDKTFMEKYFNNFKENVTDNMNPLAMIPYAKDAVSIMEGYDVARQDMQGISTVVNGAKKITKYITDEEYREKHTLWEVSKELIKGGSQLLGVPVYNPIRDIEAIWNTYFPDNRMGGRIYSKTENYNMMLDAILENDTETYNRVKEDLMTKGVEVDDIPSKIASKVRERYLNGELTAGQAEKILNTDLGYDLKTARDKIEKWNE